MTVNSQRNSKGSQMASTETSRGTTIGLAEAVERLREARTIWVASHVNPDADGLGAGLALARALRGAGKEAVLVLYEPPPAALHFLPGIDAVRDLSEPALPAPTLVMTLDAGSLGQLGPLPAHPALATAPLLVVDHHVSNERFGTWNWLEFQAAATCEMAFDLLQALGAPVDATAATALLAGIVYDTQVFRTSNTTPHTLRVAADLIERGAPIADIVEQLYQTKPLSTLQLWGLALSRAERRGRVIWTRIDPAMLAATGAQMAESDGLIDLLMQDPATDTAVVFKDSGNGPVRVSLRTQGRVDATQVCGHFGGGGHVRASGCRLEGPLAAAEERFLVYLEQVGAI